ncbi:MAG: hypothetical protein EZS28_021017 [Streblomastix strix]|uniref:Uncharacterized protein n=1 Tax=Streblomastix strix TaxID=222440 RepID=A0A5J4VLY9_9EUKA|nr:MAG: hypothetical protein EZS28_021017 [Streblomastix strix]
METTKKRDEEFFLILSDAKKTLRLTKRVLQAAEELEEEGKEEMEAQRQLYNKFQPLMAFSATRKYVSPVRAEAQTNQGADFDDMLAQHLQDIQQSRSFPS